MKFDRKFFQEFADAGIAKATKLLEERRRQESGDSEPLPLEPLLEFGKWRSIKHPLEKVNLLLANGADPQATPGILVKVQALGGVTQKQKHDVMAALLAVGVDPNVPDPEGKTVLMVVVQAETPSLDLARLLITAGAAPDFRDGDGRTCLSWAVASKSRELGSVLLDTGAAVDAKCSRGRSPLSYAAASPAAAMDTLELLVERGALPDEADTAGRTPLIHAASSGLADKASFLIRRGADPEHTDAEGKTALHHSCVAEHPRLVRLLLDAGADVERRDASGRTPLMYAIRDAKTATALLAAKPDVNALDGEGNGALLHAIASLWRYSADDISIIKALLKRGADARRPNLAGKTPIHRAAETSSLPAIEILLRAGADINASDASGSTPLMSCHGPDAIALLLQSGADPKARDASGATVLMRLVSHQGVDARSLELLLGTGGDLNARDNEGRTALMHACRSGAGKRVVQRLIGAGAELDLLDDAGNSATVFAGQEVLKLLIAAGAKANPNESGQLMRALRDDDIPLATLLLERGINAPLDLPWFAALKKTLEKLARSSSELLRARVHCLDPETRGQFDALLAQFARNEEIADEEDLPEILRKGAWPIRPQARRTVVLPESRVAEVSRSIGWFDGAVRRPKGLKEGVLDEIEAIRKTRKSRNVEDSASSSQSESFSSLLSERSAIDLIPLLDGLDNEREPEFIRFWNENSLAFVRTRVLFRDRWDWLSASEVARILLARFGVAILPGIITASENSPSFADPLLTVDAPVCAPLVATWMASGPAAKGARKWALSYPESCARGLIPDAISKVGKARTAAEAALRFLASRGHRAMITELATQLGEDVRESVTESLSQDYRADYAPSKPVRLPSFWSADIYPPPRLKANGKALPAYAIDALSSMMSGSTVEVRCPALDEVLEACDPKSLAAFSWAAFEEWAAKGKSDSGWIFDALAYLGDDTCARKLTPYIREWPRKSGIARARRGLEILAAIGSDVALSQIQAIAQKNKYQSVLESAQAMMKVIAAARELSPSQLEDRLVPDLGLSDKGELRLDFGSRQFIGSVDARLTPVVIDASGAKLKALPSAGKEDDKALAKAAATTWAEFSKDLKPVAKLQLQRLELAMVNSRRWTGAEFKSLLVPSPLLQAPVKGLVWGLFALNSKLPATFTVSADGALLDVQGQAIEVTDEASVGIVHPVLMSDTSLAAWTHVFSEKRQLQPFAQLARKVYRAKEDVRKDTFGLNGTVVASKALKGLIAAGWSTEVEGAGAIWSFYKHLSSGQATLNAEPGVVISDYEVLAKEQTIEVTIPARLDPIEFSEVVRELMVLRK
jgi:ankyrin repeat protein